MNNQILEKNKLLTNKYGHQAFFGLMIEIGIIALLYSGIESSDAIYNLLYSIKTSELLLALVPFPIGYYAIRGVISGCINAKQYYSYYFLAPVVTLMFLSQSNGMIFKIPSLTVLWLLFFTSIWKIKKIKKVI